MVEEDKVNQVIIEFDGNKLRVKHPNDAMLTLAMLSLADAEVKEKLQGHRKAPSSIIDVKKERINYPPPPEKS